MKAGHPADVPVVARSDYTFWARDEEGYLSLMAEGRCTVRQDLKLPEFPSAGRRLRHSGAQGGSSRGGQDRARDGDRRDGHGGCLRIQAFRLMAD